MKFLKNAFVVVHIRLSHIKICKVSIRSVITVGFIVLSLVGIYDVYTNIIYEISFIGFVESAIYLLVVLYLLIFWISAWSKANKMLNKAIGYDEKISDDKKRKK